MSRTRCQNDCVSFEFHIALLTLANILTATVTLYTERNCQSLKLYIHVIRCICEYASNLNYV